jgi:hypothetical protein
MASVKFSGSLRARAGASEHPLRNERDNYTGEEASPRYTRHCVLLSTFRETRIGSRRPLDRR